MALTIAQQIAAIDVKIAELVANPQVDHTEGDVTIKAGQKMTQLLAARKALLEQPCVESSVEMLVFSEHINEFGMRH